MEGSLLLRASASAGGPPPVFFIFFLLLAADDVKAFRATSSDKRLEKHESRVIVVKYESTALIYVLIFVFYLFIWSPFDNTRLKL